MTADSTIPEYSQAAFTRRLFGVTLTVMVSAIGIAEGLIMAFGAPPRDVTLSLPWAFHASTILLFAGSACMHFAIVNVRREHQMPFRNLLLASLVIGTLFVGVQSYGIWCLLRQLSFLEETQTGVDGFVFVFAVLHALHFTLAMWFLVFVTLRSLQDRYDHEYYWGVTVCTWFWHTLGAVWLAILMVFAIAI